MPTARTRCPACQLRIDFEPGQCALLGGPDGHPVAYAFVCPGCDEPVVKPADGRAAALLVAGGASASGVREHVGWLHPERPAPGPPLTCDDLIDFHLLLADPHWADRALNPAVGEAARAPAPGAKQRGGAADRSRRRR